MANITDPRELSIVARAAYEVIKLQPFLPTYLHLLTSAIFPIWTGAHASLSRPSSAAKPARKERKPRASEDDDSDDDDLDEDLVVQKMEGLSPSDAIVFPIMAAMTLGSLYYIIQWLKDPAMLNKILRVYFSQMGFFFGIKFIKDALSVARGFIFPNQYVSGGKTWKVSKPRNHFEADESSSFSKNSNGNNVRKSPLPGFLGRIRLPARLSSSIWFTRSLVTTKAILRFHLKSVLTLKSSVDFLDFISLVVALVLVSFHLLATNPWYLTNFFGFSFCYGSLQLMSPTTFWTGSLILSALFFYDIYFVFFTPLMVTVATKLDVPIKLLFPRPPPAGAAPDAAPSLAMLGLGDVVIPGMMVGLALRFDLFMHYRRKQKMSTAAKTDTKDKVSIEKEEYTPSTGQWGERWWSWKPFSGVEASPTISATQFPKTYFKASVIGYLSGMVATLAAMQIAEHAQPALLYLVPGVLSSLWGTALFRGEIGDMWNFSEDYDDDDEGKDGTNKDSKDKKQKADQVNDGIIDTIRSYLGLAETKTEQKKAETNVKVNDDENSKPQDISSSEDGKKSTIDSIRTKDGQQDTETEDNKKKSGDTSRKLLDFSITLPKPPTATVVAK